MGGSDSSRWVDLIHLYGLIKRLQDGLIKQLQDLQLLDQPIKMNQ